jgi:hypothetical protein
MHGTTIKKEAIFHSYCVYIISRLLTLYNYIKFLWTYELSVVLVIHQFLNFVSQFVLIYLAYLLVYYTFNWNCNFNFVIIVFILFYLKIVLNLYHFISITLACLSYWLALLLHAVELIMFLLFLYPLDELLHTEFLEYYYSWRWSWVAAPHPSHCGTTGGYLNVLTVTRYRLDAPAIEYRWGARFSAPIQTGPRPHPASCAMGSSYFPEIKRPERGVNHPPPSSAEVLQRATSLLPIWPSMACYRVFFSIYPHPVFYICQ